MEEPGVRPKKILLHPITTFVAKVATSLKSVWSINYAAGYFLELFPRSIPNFDDLLLITLVVSTGEPLLALGETLLRFDCITLLPKSARSLPSSLLKLLLLSVLSVRTDDLRAMAGGESLPIDLFPLWILEPKKEGSHFWMSFISNWAVIDSVIRFPLSFHSSLFSLALLKYSYPDTPKQPESISFCASGTKKQMYSSG